MEKADGSQAALEVCQSVACVVRVFRASGSQLRQEGAHMLLELYNSMQQSDTMRAYDSNKQTFISGPTRSCLRGDLGPDRLGAVG